MTTEALAGRGDLAQPLHAIDVSDPGHLPAGHLAAAVSPGCDARRRIHYCPESRFGPYWSVTRYNDIMTVELDHATYSSQLGGIQVEDQPADMKRRQLHPHGPAAPHRQRKTVPRSRLRSTSRATRRLIRERTRSVLDALPRNEAFDWVDKVSSSSRP